MYVNSSAIDAQRQQRSARGDDSGFDAFARIWVNHESDAPTAPSAADLSGKRALAARRRNYLVDQGSRDCPQIAATKIPFFLHQAANLAPFVSLESVSDALRDDRDFFQVLRNAPVAIDVPLEYFPVVDSMLPGFSCVTQDEAELEFVEIAAEGFTPLAARRQDNGGSAAECRRVMVLRACRDTDDDCLDVAADVNPIFTAQPGTGQPVQGGTNGHGHGGRTADSRASRRFGICGQREPARWTENPHEVRQQGQLIAARAA